MFVWLQYVATITACSLRFIVSLLSVLSCSRSPLCCASRPLLCFGLFPGPIGCDHVFGLAYVSCGETSGVIGHLEPCSFVLRVFFAILFSNLTRASEVKCSVDVSTFLGCPV